MNFKSKKKKQTKIVKLIIFYLLNNSNLFLIAIEPLIVFIFSSLDVYIFFKEFQRFKDNLIFMHFDSILEKKS